jgi:type VI secretion system secreted protein VgrG
MPPYGLPDSKKISGLKSQTYKGEGYNEFIMDDTPGNELIRLHAQYDMDSTIEHDDRQTVHNNRTITVNGTHTETIKKDTTIKITEGKLVHDVVANTATYHVQGDVKENFDATQKTTVGNEIEIKSNSAHIHLTAATEIKLEVGASSLLMKSDGSIKLKGIDIAVDGVTVNTHGVSVTSQADADHNTKGAIVISEASGANTVKGGMVMLNP